jgi:hypothetical protein
MDSPSLNHEEASIGLYGRVADCSTLGARTRTGCSVLYVDANHEYVSTYAFRVRLYLAL